MAIIMIYSVLYTIFTAQSIEAKTFEYIGEIGACMTLCNGAETLAECPGNCNWGAHYRNQGMDQAACEQQAIALDEVVAYSWRTDNRCWLYIEDNTWSATAAGSGWAGVELSETQPLGCTYQPESNHRCYMLSTDPCAGVTCADNKVCIDGYCSRDCDAFIIDDFLRDCSAEFHGNEGEISALQAQVSDLETDLSEGGATEGRLDGIEFEIAGNDDDISEIQGTLAVGGTIDVRFNALEGNVQGIADGISGQIEDRFVAIETGISGAGGINSRLDALEGATQPGGVVEVRFESIEAQLSKFAAHSQTENVIGSVEKASHSLWTSNESKDRLFMFLLILNTVLMVGFAIACVVLNRSRKSNKYDRYSQTTFYSSETEDENQRLQR